MKNDFLNSLIKYNTNLRVYYFIVDYIILFIISLLVVTLEDFLLGRPMAIALSEWFHYITPVIIGSIGSILCYFVRSHRNMKDNFHKQLLESIEEVQETKHYFETLMQQAPSVIEIYDMSGLQISVNQAYEKLWSFPASTTVNKFNVLQSKEVAETDLINYVKRAYAGESVIVPPYEFDPSGETESKGFGRKRWLSTKIFPLKDKNNDVKNIVITHEDISERKYAEDEIIKAKEKAVESDKLKTAFLANMSHEIRTPMNGILGFADLLKNPGLIESKQEKYLTIIKKSGQRMLNIINELIDISQIESGQIKLANNIFSCNDILLDQFNFFQPEASKRNIELIYEKPDSDNDCRLNTDMQKLNQVISNLIKNALKYTHKGYIKIGYKPNSKGVEFFIEDTGIGIENKLKDKVFDRFRQVHKSITNEESGIGLGLSISKSYVELMNGEISIDSELGKGSRFTVIIPNQESEPTIKSYIKPTYDEERFIRQKISILIAEDDEISFEYFKELMLNAPIKLFYARTGNEAVRLAIENDTIELVLMDIRMPDLDGLKATKKIKKIKPSLPIIVQTAFTSDSSKTEALKAGCDEFITKPINMHILISKIQDLVPEKKII